MTDLYRPIHNADLLLSQDEFSALMASVRDSLYREDARWLDFWLNYDATHPMTDKERRRARREHYLGFYKKMCEELLK